MKQEHTKPTRYISPRIIYHGSRKQNIVAITFDDGPAPWTSRILDVLKAEGAPATFFVIGMECMPRHKILLRTLREGHEIGLHTWDHTNCKKKLIPK